MEITLVDGIKDGHKYELVLGHLPTTEVVGLPLRKKSRGVWQGDSSP